MQSANIKQRFAYREAPTEAASVAAAGMNVRGRLRATSGSQATSANDR